MGGQCHVSVTLPPAKETQYPTYRRLRGSHSWSGQVQKILHPLRFERRTAQPLGSPSRPTNYTILAANSVVKHKFSVRCMYISIPGKFLQVLPPDSHQLLLLCNILLLFNVTVRQILIMCKRGETIDSYQFRNPFTVPVMTTCQNDIEQSEEL